MGHFKLSQGFVFREPNDIGYPLYSNIREIIPNEDPSAIIALKASQAIFMEISHQSQSGAEFGFFDEEIAQHFFQNNVKSKEMTDSVFRFSSIYGDYEVFCVYDQSRDNQTTVRYIVRDMYSRFCMCYDVEITGESVRIDYYPHPEP